MFNAMWLKNNKIPNWKQDHRGYTLHWVNAPRQLPRNQQSNNQSLKLYLLYRKRRHFCQEMQM